MILIDDREVSEHPELSELLKVVLPPGIPILVERLDAADYSFLDSVGRAVGIERCEVKNLVQKLISGELEAQLTKCADIYQRVYLLTEGVYSSLAGLLTVFKEGEKVYYRDRVYPNTYYAYVLASLVRLSDFGVELIHTPNLPCTVTAIAIIYKEQRKPEDERTLFKKIRPIKMPQKISKNPAVGRLMGLCPRLPEKVALALVLKYGSIWNILHTEDKELLEVDGFGKGLLSKLKETVGKEVT
jgi:ERCC4-type nuclease